MHRTKGLTAGIRYCLGWSLLWLGLTVPGTLAAAPEGAAHGRIVSAPVGAGVLPGPGPSVAGPSFRLPAAAPVLLADSWWEMIYGPLESSLGSRQRMLQFGAVCMITALVIIW